MFTTEFFFVRFQTFVFLIVVLVTGERPSITDLGGVLIDFNGCINALDVYFNFITFEKLQKL